MKLLICAAVAALLIAPVSAATVHDCDGDCRLHTFCDFCGELLNECDCEDFAYVFRCGDCGKTDCECVDSARGGDVQAMATPAVPVPAPTAASIPATTAVTTPETAATATAGTSVAPPNTRDALADTSVDLAPQTGTFPGNIAAVVLAGLAGIAAIAARKRRV